MCRELVFVHTGLKVKSPTFLIQALPEGRRFGPGVRLTVVKMPSGTSSASVPHAVSSVPLLLIALFALPDQGAICLHSLSLILRVITCSAAVPLHAHRLSAHSLNAVDWISAVRGRQAGTHTHKHSPPSCLSLLPGSELDVRCLTPCLDSNT